MSRLQVFVFAILVVASIFLHLVNISHPNNVIFDEAHFATYAARHSLGLPVFDIHPPLGKLIFAAPLLVNGLGDQTAFIDIYPNSETGNLEMKRLGDNTFGDFPYADLRIVSALFGILLTLSVYFFLLSLTENINISLLGLFLITFENALLIHTRLIFMDGIYLSLGIIGLALFFSKKHPQPILGGVIWGLALSVKLTAIVFLGAFIFTIIYPRLTAYGNHALQAMRNFVLSGLIVLLFFLIVVNNAIAPMHERMDLYKNLVPNLTKEMNMDHNSSQDIKGTLLLSAKIFWVELGLTLGGYTSAITDDTHPSLTNWYQWPLPATHGPILLHADEVGEIKTSGNLIIWYGSLLAILFVLFRFIPTILSDESAPEAVLFGGYIFSLLPFVPVIGIVTRTTFIYHYYPALLFGICALAVLLEKLKNKLTPTRRQLFIVGICIIIVGGFIFSAPFTYGL